MVNFISNIKKGFLNDTKNMETYKYQNIVPYEKRCEDSLLIRYKYPDRIPVILNINDISLELKKYKLLIPEDYTISLALCGIRKQLVLENYQSIFIFCDNILLANSEIIGELYNNYKIRNNINNYEGDQYLYLTLCMENTFGKN